MSLLDTASLIVTPNGVKEGKLYSVIPSDGSGDMSVVRATTATRVNSAGLVELVPYNLLTYSEQLNDSSWNKLNVTITPNTTIAPDGTLTADTMTNSSTGYGLWQQVSVAPSTQYTFSFYVKKGTNTSYIISVIDAVSFTGIASLDYSSQVGVEWVRVSTTFTTPSTTSFIRIYQMRDGSSTGTAFLWGAQLNEGTIKPYQKTETRLNIPRLDYSNGTCPSLLVEPQRTNLITYSEQFNQWSPQAIGTASLPVVTSNAAIAPNGLQVADKIVFNSGSGTGAFDWSFIISNSFSTSAVSYTGSIYLKGENGGEQIQIRHAASGSYTKLTLTTEWQRFDTIETGTGSSANMELAIRRDLNEPMNATATIYAWAAQVEVGSYPTSYIPTTSASVTRNADVISKTGISSLIGQTEGTLFVDAYITGKNSSNGSILFATDKVSSGAIMRILYTQTDALRFDVFDGSSFQCQISAGAYNVGDRVKIAGAYKNNDFVMYVNGTQIGTDTSGTVPATDTANINTSIYGDSNGSFIQAAALWKTRLTNDELASLTTL